MMGLSAGVRLGGSDFALKKLAPSNTLVSSTRSLTSALFSALMSDVKLVFL